MPAQTPGYDAFAADFERHAEASAYNACYDRPAVLALLGDVTSQRVLDAGCGPGLYAAELLARGAVVTGFDASAEMVRLARARLAGRARIRQHDLAVPLGWLPSACMDAAVLALVIHHLDDRVAALRELHRVLVPGGHLVVSTHHPAADWANHGGSYFEAEVIEETWSRGWQVRYWRQPLQLSCDEFASAGFLIERLAEPRPDARMASEFPDDYARLSAQPGFIAFRLLKPA